MDSTDSSLALGTHQAPSDWCDRKAPIGGAQGVLGDWSSTRHFDPNAHEKRLALFTAGKLHLALRYDSQREDLCIFGSLSIPPPTRFPRRVI